jgi:hypothetical protein
MTAEIYTFSLFRCTHVSDPERRDRSRRMKMPGPCLTVPL